MLQPCLPTKPLSCGCASAQDVDQDTLSTVLGALRGLVVASLGCPAVSAMRPELPWLCVRILLSSKNTTALPGPSLRAVLEKKVRGQEESLAQMFTIPIRKLGGWGLWSRGLEEPSFPALGEGSLLQDPSGT